MATGTSSRITTIDALRGFALFGILYAHMVLWYSGGPLPEKMYTQNYGIASSIAMGIYFVFFLAKFFSIFSFLFGISFYIQMHSLMQRGERFVPRFAWRLAILGLIGLAHHSLWRGDILTIYAPLGFLLIIARKLPDRALLALGALLILNVPTHVIEAVVMLVNGKPLFSSADAMAGGAAYYETMKHAPLLTMVIDNLHAFPAKFAYQISSGRLLITFGFFLLGMYVGSQRWFEQLAAHQPLFQRALKTSGKVLLGTLVLTALAGAAGHLSGLDMQKSLLAMWSAGVVADIVNACLTIVYISGFTLLMARNKWRRVLAPLASVGKMALSVYVMQTVLALLLFCSFGLGLFGTTTPAMNALLALAIFAIQIGLSTVWLKRFHYGPIEWLWRSATYLKWQKMWKSGQPVGLSTA